MIKPGGKSFYGFYSWPISSYGIWREILFPNKIDPSWSQPWQADRVQKFWLRRLVSISCGSSLSLYFVCISGRQKIKSMTIIIKSWKLWRVGTHQLFKWHLKLLPKSVDCDHSNLPNSFLPNFRLPERREKKAVKGKRQSLGWLTPFTDFLDGGIALQKLFRPKCKSLTGTMYRHMGRIYTMLQGGVKCVKLTTLWVVTNIKFFGCSCLPLWSLFFQVWGVCLHVWRNWVQSCSKGKSVSNCIFY